MKRILLLTSLISFLLLQTGISQTISGSAHDFSGAAWNTSGEICIVCHTPHNSDTDVAEAPLWNHALSAELAYNVYSNGSSATLDAIMTQPSAQSKLCLCCHDGTVALDSYGGAAGANMIGVGGDLGSDLRDDHPISFTYNTALATSDGGLFNPSVVTTSLGGTIDNDLLFSSVMQCSSCHDVHDDTNGNFLIIDNSGSALCLTCHNK